MNSDQKVFVPKLYYAVTPVFILLDYVWHINVRVVVLDSYPLYKGLYYGFCVLCGVFVYVVPRCSSVVALVESAILFTMTILGIFISYAHAILQMDDVLNADIQTISIVIPPQVINLVLAGGMALWTFKRSLRELGISDL
jgi:glucan phosphoethanolaminetransferase (alkaline phosphatase superfamily)